VVSPEHLGAFSLSKVPLKAGALLSPQYFDASYAPVQI
jgi:hypothetical protein